MKTAFERSFLKSLSIVAGTILGATLILSCSDDDSGSSPQVTDSIVQVAQSSSDLSILVDALTRVDGFVNTLADENGTFTVFAPTNEAFAQLLEVIGQSSLDDIPTSVLERILSYHVISGAAIASTDLSDGQTAGTLLTGESINVSISGSSVAINSSNVVSADVNAVNGIVHIVDAVLVPSLEASIVNTVVEPAYFSTDFEILTAAVVQAGLLETLINPEANLTVFAPTDDAFEAAGITSLDGISNEDLEALLLYHVLGAEVMASDLPATGSAIETLNGDVFLSINNDGVFLNASSQVVATDVEASNGVVHVLGRTLTQPAPNDIVDIAINLSQSTNAEFTQLVAAVVAVEGDSGTDPLATILGGTDSGPFTLFAPTDAAFEELYQTAGVQDLDGLIAAVGIGTLEAVLKYHVVAGAQVLSTDLPNLTSPTVSSLGGSFTVDLGTLTITETDAALTLDSDNIANIIGTDVIGTNGVIHTIDKVILP